MQTRILNLVKNIAIPLLVGTLATVLTVSGMAMYPNFSKPPFSPPGWLFPVVWTILYTLMGIAFFLVTEKENADKEMTDQAALLYGLQLMVNFFWPILFFGFGWYCISFLWILLLWGLIILMLRQFGKISKRASYLMIPYLVWVTFAAYLNLGICFLNRG